MAKEDLTGSLATVKMLGKTGLLPQADADTITAGLTHLLKTLAAGKYTFTVTNTHITLKHTALHTATIGPVAGKLHTARSRKHQVATDLTLWLKTRLPAIKEAYTLLQTVLVGQAKAHAATILPGYTQLQHAQPITYGTYLLAYFTMFQRDWTRFDFTQKHTTLLHTPAAALAGTTFPIHRTLVAQTTHFDQLYHNSLDAVSDRDFAHTFLSNSAIYMQTLSRLATTYILWSNLQFN